MTAIRDLWSMLRGHRSRFGPGGPAAGEQPGGPRTATVEQSGGVEPPAVAEPDLARLCADGEKLLQAARAGGRTPALAVMQIEDLPEIELAFGRAGVVRVMAAVMSGLTRAAAGHGLVVRTAPDTFALLMPGGGAGAAIAAVQARFGKPCTIEVACGRDEILAVPDVMVSAVGPQDSIAQVYGELCCYIGKARHQVRPARVTAQQRAARGTAATSQPPGRPAPAPRYTPPQPATIPMPLGVH